MMMGVSHVFGRCVFFGFVWLDTSVEEFLGTPHCSCCCLIVALQPISSEPNERAPTAGVPFLGARARRPRRQAVGVPAVFSSLRPRAVPVYGSLCTTRCSAVQVFLGEVSPAGGFRAKWVFAEGAGERDLSFSAL